MQTEFTYYESNIGKIILTARGELLTGIYLPGGKHEKYPLSDWIETPGSEVLVKTRQQLQEFFEGERTTFEIPLSTDGTDFQQLVWNELRRIPFGETITYGELARRIDRPKAIRAVGSANGQNRISIVIPCHRVIGSNGTLTGYAGGLDMKRKLLDHEKVRLLLHRRH